MPTLSASLRFEAAMTRQMLKAAIKDHDNLEDMCRKLEATEKKEKELEKKEEEEKELAREAAAALEKDKTIKGKMERAAHWFNVTRRAKKALTELEASKTTAKKEPPEVQNSKWWGEPPAFSENEIMLKGIKGWATSEIESLVASVIGKKVKPKIERVGAGYLAVLEFKDKEESEEALVKMRYIKNPCPGAIPEWLYCSRARAKRSGGTTEYGKEVADEGGKDATRGKASEERTKDKEKSEEERGPNPKAGPSRSKPQQEEETVAPMVPTPRAEEEPEVSAFWTHDQADEVASDETYEKIATLRSQFPVYWVALMKIESEFLTNEEALEETRSMEKTVLKERSQVGKSQERKRRSRAEPEESDKEDQKRKRRRQNPRHRRRTSESRSVSQERKVKRR